MTNVSDIMVDNITIDHTSTVNQAARMMDKNNRGCILVTDKGAPVGVLTERDILRLVASGEPVFNRKLSNYFTKKLVIASDKTSLDDAIKIMGQNGVRRLFITRNGKIVGVVTANLIAKNIKFSMAEKLMSGMVQKQGIEGGFW